VWYPSHSGCRLGSVQFTDIGNWVGPWGWTVGGLAPWGFCAISLWPMGICWAAGWGGARDLSTASLLRTRFVGFVGGGHFEAGFGLEVGLVAESVGPAGFRGTYIPVSASEPLLPQIETSRTRGHERQRADVHNNNFNYRCA